MTHPLQWKKFPVLNDGFICLVDCMGDDSSIVQAARVSYGNDKEERIEYRCDDTCPVCQGNVFLDVPKKHGKGNVRTLCSNATKVVIPKRPSVMELDAIEGPEAREAAIQKAEKEIASKDRSLIRYMMNHGHTTPFEMVVIKFKVRVPMDCWRQWIRHRTASVNEYSTRYSEAIDSQQITPPDQWRLQATDNKQGSSGFLEGPINNFLSFQEGLEFFDFMEMPDAKAPAGKVLSVMEEAFHQFADSIYQLRLRLGIAKEQARKDLPLSTYTEAYWCCDLHNIFNFLRQRMDSHAQLEIRSYANAMAEIVKQLVPVAWEAFEDYQLHARKFSRMEMEVLKRMLIELKIDNPATHDLVFGSKPASLTDREWKEFLAKLS